MIAKSSALALLLIAGTSGKAQAAAHSSVSTRADVAAQTVVSRAKSSSARSLSSSQPLIDGRQHVETAADGLAAEMHHVCDEHASPSAALAHSSTTAAAASSPTSQQQRRHPRHQAFASLSLWPGSAKSLQLKLPRTIRAVSGLELARGQNHLRFQFNSEAATSATEAIWHVFGPAMCAVTLALFVFTRLGTSFAMQRVRYDDSIEYSFIFTVGDKDKIFDTQSAAKIYSLPLGPISAAGWQLCFLVAGI